MDLYFLNEEDDALFHSEKKLRQKYGKDEARAIRKRIDHLEAAMSLGDLPFGARTHNLNNERKGQYSITTKLPYTLIVEPVGDIKDGHLGQIKAVLIVSHKNYHK